MSPKDEALFKKLQATYQKAVAKKQNPKIINKILAESDNDAVITEWCLWVLENFGDEDASSAVSIIAHELVRRHQVEAVPRLQAAYENLPTRRAVFDYRKPVQIAIEVLQTHDEPLCSCEIAAAFKNNHQSVANMIVQNVETKPYGEVVYSALCLTCQRQWAVTENTSYHAPVYSWRAIKKK